MQMILPVLPGLDRWCRPPSVPMTGCFFTMTDKSGRNTQSMLLLRRSEKHKQILLSEVSVASI